VGDNPVLMAYKIWYSIQLIVTVLGQQRY